MNVYSVSLLYPAIRLHYLGFLALSIILQEDVAGKEKLRLEQCKRKQLSCLFGIM